MVTCLMNRVMGDDGVDSSTPSQLSLASSSLKTPPSSIKTKQVMLKREIETKHVRKNEELKRMKTVRRKNMDEAFPLRKALPYTLHKRVRGDQTGRPSCESCAWLYHNSPSISKTTTYQKYVNRTSHMCYYCKTYLCKKCFDPFHQSSGMPPL